MKTHFVITRQINSLNLAESFLSLMSWIVHGGAGSVLTLVSVDYWTWPMTALISINRLLHGEGGTESLFGKSQDVVEEVFTFS